MAGKISRTYTTATRSFNAPVAAAVSATASTSTTPFGFTTGAQADALVAAVNNLIVDVANDKQVLNTVINELEARNIL